MPGDAGGETTVIKRPAQREDRWFWNRVDKVTLPGRRSNGEGDKETMKPRLASADLKGPSSLVDVRSTTKQGPNNTSSGECNSLDPAWRTNLLILVASALAGLLLSFVAGETMLSCPLLFSRSTQ